MTKLISRPEGNFSYLPGSTIYCRGAVADKGFSMAHATFKAPVPLARAFADIKTHLYSIGRPMQALAGLELRIPKPLSFDGFGALSVQYTKLLDKFGLRVGADATTTRTNVALERIDLAPKQPGVYGFTYTIPGARGGGRTGFIGSGIGELDGNDRNAIIALGKTNDKAMRAKAEWVMSAIAAQLAELGVKWSDVSNTNIYTVHGVDKYVEDVVLGVMGPAARYGVHWMFTRPPIDEIEFELDVRGTSQELFL
jgi:hypothetical protein